MPKRQFHLLDGVSFGKDNTIVGWGLGDGTAEIVVRDWQN
jgi:hypothetical protein